MLLAAHQPSFAAQRAHHQHIDENLAHEMALHWPATPYRCVRRAGSAQTTASFCFAAIQPAWFTVLLEAWQQAITKCCYKPGGLKSLHGC